MQVTLIHLEDKPRAGVSDVIAELQDKARLRVMMLTGDHESSARRVAKAVGITEVHYSLKPENKLNHVKSISRDMGEPFAFFKIKLLGLRFWVRKHGCQFPWFDYLFHYRLPCSSCI